MIRSLVVRSLFWLCCGFTLGLLTTGAADAKSGILTGRASVIDGDTMEVARQRIRIANIDAPESAQPCHLPGGRTWRCGAAAANALADWLGARPVTCVQVGKSWDRIVARCEVDGADLATWLVGQGWALDSPKYSKGAFAHLEAEARAAQRGVWREGGSVQEPWEWRRR